MSQWAMDFGHHVDNANDELHEPPRGSLADHVEQLATEREDLVGVPEHRLAHLGGNEVTPGTAQKLLAEVLFKPPDLRADGRRRQGSSSPAAATLPVRATVQKYGGDGN